jgi:hypothetical protein
VAHRRVGNFFGRPIAPGWRGSTLPLPLRLFTFLNVWVRSATHAIWRGTSCFHFRNNWF